MAKSQIYSRGPKGIVYANPSDPDCQMRLHTETFRKSLNGVQVENKRTDLVYTDLNPVTLPGKNGDGANDALSVRVRISGSTLSDKRLKEMMRNVGNSLIAWAEQPVIMGFEPSESPDI